MSAQPDQPQARIEIEFQGEIRIDVRFDAVAYFWNMRVDERARYWEHNLHEFGFTEEWERPASWLLGLLDDEAVPGMLFHAPGMRDWSDGPEWDNVTWRAEDFDRLVAAVPWLKPPPEDEDDEEREYRLARLPGPHDVPLFPEKPRRSAPVSAPRHWVDVKPQGDLL